MEQLQLGDLKLTWLNGGNNHMDGGAMFGVVPKPLWSRKYPSNEKNQVPLRTDPILIEKGQTRLLIDSGMGQGKVTEKQKRNFGISEESSIKQSLQELGLHTGDIDYVLLTHLHFDHACGLTEWENERLVPVFPQAAHVVSHTEWHEMRHPNIRSRNTYWQINWESLEDVVQPFEGEKQIIDGITMLHTGGHSAGHSVILFESQEQKGIHFGDLMPTHAHQNPLWVLAYDDYPMDSVFFKQDWVPKVMQEEWWITFYHDAFMRAVKWDAEGSVVDQVKIRTSGE